MAESHINLLQNLYDEFTNIINNITIKYTYLADKYETLESRQYADQYLDVVNGSDNFFTYIDYTLQDYTYGIIDTLFKDKSSKENWKRYCFGYYVLVNDSDIKSTDLHVKISDTINTKTEVKYSTVKPDITNFIDVLILDTHTAINISGEVVVGNSENIYADVIETFNGIPSYKFFKYIGDEYIETEVYVRFVTSEYSSIIQEPYTRKDPSLYPKVYRNAALAARRERILSSFEEKNNYYRMLNGYPNIEDKDDDYLYIIDTYCDLYDIDPEIPLHRIQDYYNNIKDGTGDNKISIIEGLGLINVLKYKKNGLWRYLSANYKSIDEYVSAKPDKKYVKYIGSTRISINNARKAKNFAVLQLIQGDINTTVYDEFLLKYEQAREYYCKTIYIHEYGEFISYYDNFIAMCIMIMALQQIQSRQIFANIKRDYFDINSVKALYDVYNVPYNLDIDEDAQRLLVRNLNLLIQNKATNKVFYNIAELLGFTDINIYKYYLAKVRRFDQYGAPVIATTEKFNSNTGNVETVPDYESMYEIYFHKEDLNSKDLISTFSDASNKTGYNEMVSADPYWFTDDNLYTMLYESPYNFVESKYLGVGVAYSMTKIMFENVMLMKMIMSMRMQISTVGVYLPKILDNISTPLYDVIILLMALTASKHNLTGEIVTIVSQVVSVEDFMNNIDDFTYCADTLSFNFEYFKLGNTKLDEDMEKLKSMLSTSAYEEYKSYISYIQSSTDTPVNKINNMYEKFKNIYYFLIYHMSVTNDRKVYEFLHTLYKSIFISREMKELFTIKGELTGHVRTAYTYFEYLHYLNPGLYNTIFEMDYDKAHKEYCKEHGLSPSEYTKNDYIKDIEYGNIKADFSTLILVNPESSSEKETTLYKYITHVIDRLQSLLGGLNYIFLLNGTTTPLVDLLVKLIRFFKSYTVDLVDFSTTFVMDFKPANSFRLFEHMWLTEKTLGFDDSMNFTFSDYLHYIESQMKLKDNTLKFEDFVRYQSLLTLNQEKIELIDKLYKLIKTIGVNDKFEIKDVIHHINANIRVKDKISFDDLLKITANLRLEDITTLKELVNYLEKAIQLKETLNLSFADDTQISATKQVSDKYKLQDKVTLYWS